MQVTKSSYKFLPFVQFRLTSFSEISTKENKQAVWAERGSVGWKAITWFDHSVAGRSYHAHFKTSAEFLVLQNTQTHA